MPESEGSSVSFLSDRDEQAEENWASATVREKAQSWHDFSRTISYQYMFTWCGLPIIQDPQDVLFVHEVLWDYQPEIIIETGVARGGSLLLSASILATLHSCGKIQVSSAPKVIGIDVDIRAENRKAIDESHLARFIHLIEGSSVDPKVVSDVARLVADADRVALILDSNHSHDHVFRELLMYEKFIQEAGPIIVMDTGIEFAPVESFRKLRPWGPGNSPYTAVVAFLETNQGNEFRIDQTFQKRHLITSARDGLLRRKG